MNWAAVSRSASRNLSGVESGRSYYAGVMSSVKVRGHLLKIRILSGFFECDTYIMR